MSSFLTFSDGAYLQKNVADDLYLSKLDATTDYLSKTEAASTYITDASIANTYLPKNNPQLSSQSTLDIRLSNGIQVSSQTTISPSTFENWNNLFGIPNVALTGDGIIFKKQPYYSSSVGYQPNDALVTKTYTDQQIATRGGLTTDNTWTGTNSFQNPNNIDQYFNVSIPSSEITSKNLAIRTLDENGVVAVAALDFSTRWGVRDVSGNLVVQVPENSSDTVNFLQKATFSQLPTSSAIVNSSNQLVTKAYTDQQIATRGGLTTTNTWTGTNTFNQLPTSSAIVNSSNQLVTKAYADSSYATLSNSYDSGWFAVSSNSTYTFTHNLGWSFPNPPRLRLFYSDFATPILGTNQIYEISVNSMSGLYNDSSNYQYGINHIRHISSNQLLISTCVRGVYYSEGGEDVGAETSGYYRLIMFY